MSPATAARVLPLLCALVPLLSLYLQSVQDKHLAFTIAGIAAITLVAFGLGWTARTFYRTSGAPKGDQSTTG